MNIGGLKFTIALKLASEQLKKGKFVTITFPLGIRLMQNFGAIFCGVASGELNVLCSGL